ncbi:MAG TPA: VOC family protein [Vicinamibacteria bacterium]|nr:VOC family protein [Vicinamibacteria bacterium]
MLGGKNVMATIAVKDVDAAARFYEGTLGLERVGTGSSEAIVYTSGHSWLLVYRSRYAGTNRATAATWVLGEDLEDAVRALRAKGVAFEHYDLPDTTRKGDVHVAGRVRIAWLKVPDGNIIALSSE